MQPNRGGSPSSPELQPPMVTPEAGSEQGTPKAETLPARPESSPSKSAAPVIRPNPADDAQALAAAQSSVVIPSDDIPTDHAPVKQAPDSDHIEKHWVNSARQIVAQTKDDPFKQKSEMSKVKADYIKYRFNKVIKADTEAV